MVACPDGLTSATGSNDASDCNSPACPFGTFGSSASNCTTCPIGMVATHSSAFSTQTDLRLLFCFVDS
jgi:hypothetical protein